jgi:fumarylpyruvate hydrolase
MSENLVFPRSATPSLPIVGSHKLFPVRRIWCVGRNYAAHVREMGNDEREPPFFFAKHGDMVVPGGGDMSYPSLTKDLHFEVELVIAIKGTGENISVADAAGLIFGYAVGIDFTRRDLQKVCQEKGKSWEIAKSFEQSAPCSAITPLSGLLPTSKITLSVNGAVKQDSTTGHMIWSIAEVVSKLSEQVALAPGDIIFTGTPQGVGPVVRGDKVLAHVDGLTDLSVSLV